MTTATIAYSPHLHQARLHASRANKRIVVAGRQSGKTVAVVQEVAEWAMSAPKRWPDAPQPQFWWTTASYKTKPKAWRDFNHYIPREIVRQTHESESWIELRNGSRITFRSADGKEALVSETLHGFVADEAGQYSPDIYPQLLVPMTATTGGPHILLGTPRGLNWFHDVYRNASTLPDWAAFHWRTEDSPYVDPAWLAGERISTPERIWRQEFDAEFLTDGGEVFRNVDAAIGPQGVPDGFTVLGVDCAITHDWFVIWAVNSRGQWVHFDRFQRVDWPIAKLRLVQAYQTLKAAKCLVDITGMNIGGSSVVTDLQASGLVVEGVNISGPTKRALIETTMLRFEQGSLTIPNRPEVVGEFKAFSSERLASGAERFAAPSGLHDDIVVGCALALWGIRQFQGRPLPKPKTEIEQLIERDFKARMSAQNNPWLT